MLVALCSDNTSFPGPTPPTARQTPQAVSRQIRVKLCAFQSKTSVSNFVQKHLSCITFRVTFEMNYFRQGNLHLNVIMLFFIMCSFLCLTFPSMTCSKALCNCITTVIRFTNTKLSKSEFTKVVIGCSLCKTDDV